MLEFEDTAESVDERSTERMNFRTKPRIKATIQQAAALSGVDDFCLHDERSIQGSSRGDRGTRSDRVVTGRSCGLF